jgi:hypothetical protein
MQDPTEIPDDLATQLWVEPLAWGICPWAPFYQDSKHFSCHGALVCKVSGFRCGDIFQKQRFCHRDRADFRRHFNIHRNDSVPSSNTVLLWVRNFKETASATKRKPPGRESSLRIPENIKQMHQAFVRSPRWSASRNAIALRLSDCMVHRILHEDLNFHP